MHDTWNIKGQKATFENIAAPRDGTLSREAQTLVVDIIIYGDMGKIMDSNENDIGTMASGERGRNAVETCHGNVV